jgi:autotransporter-associated beta strand protein
MSFFSLNFNVDAPAYSIGDVGATASITLGTTATTGGNIINNSAFTQTINAPVAFRVGTITAATADIIFNGGTFNVGNNSNNNAGRNVTITGAANVTINSPLTGSPTISGTSPADGSNFGQIIKNGNGTLSLTNNTNNQFFTGRIMVNSGVLQASVANAFGANGIASYTSGTGTAVMGTTRVGGGSFTGRVQLVGNTTFATETLVLEGRSVSDTQLLNFTGDNTWTGPVNLTTGGGSYAIQSDSGTLAISGNITNTTGSAGVRTLALRGAGNGIVSGNIVEGTGSSNLSPFKDGSGVWTFTGSNTYSGATTVNAGTLQIGAGGTTGSLGAGSVVLSGGDLVFNRSDNQTISNAIGGTGGNLVHAANSQLTLSGDLSYSGSTTVQAGTLSIKTSKTGGGAISVASGAALTINSTQPSTTLAASALSVSGSTLNFALGTTGNPTAVMVNAGALTRDGGNVVNILGSNFTTGTISLIQYTGPAGGSGSFTLGSLPNRMLANLVDSGSELALHITGIDLPRWTGAVSSTWDSSTLANPKNWVLNSNGTTPTDYIQGDSVLFDDSSSVNNITIGETVTPNSITVSNSTKNYTFSGPGAISGAATLIKTGSGTLTFANAGANDFTGAISIGAGGTVVIGDGATSGSIGSGAIANSGVIILNRTDGPSIGNTISGSGALLVKASTLGTLAGNNTFDGAVNVQTGASLAINHANALGSTVGGTVVADGASLIVGNGGSVVFAAEPLTIGGLGTGSSPGAIHAVGTLSSLLPGTVTLNSSPLLVADSTATGILGGTIDGAGKDITVSGGGTIVLAGAGNAYANTTVSQGTLQIGNAGASGDLGTGTVSIASGATLDFNRSDLHSVANVISGDGALTKSGNGTTVLTADNTFTGSVTINRGVLRVTHANALGVGAKTIIADTRNKGFEVDGGVTLENNISFLLSNDGDLAQAGATVPFAIHSVTGNNTIKGDILLKTGGGSGAVKVDAGGTLNLNGSISIQAGQGGRAIQLGGAGFGYVNGVINDGQTGEIMSINVIGAGAPTWTLSTANTCSGNVSLQSGTLNLMDNQSLGMTFGTFCFIGNGGTAFANIPAALDIGEDGVNIPNNLWTNRDGAGSLQSENAVRTNRHIGFSATTGTGTFSGLVQINGGAVFHATPAGTLVMSGVLQNGTEAFSNGGRNDVVCNAFGTVIFSGANTYSGFTEVDAGTLILMSAAHTPVVTGPGGADLRGGRMILDYTGGGTDPTPTLYPELQNGVSVNFATGRIRSANATSAIGVGFKNDTTAQRLLLMRTYYGDADLDGTVSSVDFNALAASYGATSGKIWVDGDFNYDGKVNTLDFNYVAGNFGLTIAAPLPGSGLGSVVPEPSTTIALAGVLFGLSARRRR